MVIEEFKESDELIINPRNETKKVSLKGKSISYIVMLVNSAGFNSSSPSYLLSVLGKSMASFVKNVCEETPSTVEYNDNDDWLKLVKPKLDNCEWTIVLFSDTPLITLPVLVDAFNYAESNGVNVCKLPRGFICKTDYIKRVDRVFAPVEYKSLSDDFLVASNFEKLEVIESKMKARINLCHMKNGVQIIDSASTYIECGVTIGKDSIIYPCTALMGDTHIGEKVTIGPGTRIKHGVIGDRCNIQNSYITNSAILKSTLVETSTIENNSLVEKNCVIKHYSIISSSKIGENSVVSWSKVKGIVINPTSVIES